MKSYIKLGIGIYIGWQIAEGIDKGLAKAISYILNERKAEKETDTEE